MKKVLVYGDSNVWGDNFITRKRIDDDKQWVNIVQNNMSDKFKFIQEGLPGRIAGDFEQIKKYKNGKDTFLSIFLTSSPVDIVIISLGGNDLQLKYGRSTEEIYNDLTWYEKIISELLDDPDNHNRYFVEDKMPKFIYIVPSNFDYLEAASNIFNEESENKRKELIKYFTDNNKTIISVSDISLADDGLHYSEEGHKQMAKLVEEVLSNYE